MDEGYLQLAALPSLDTALLVSLFFLRRDNSMMYDIAAITALMEVDGGAAAAVGDGDGLAVS